MALCSPQPLAAQSDPAIEMISGASVRPQQTDSLWLLSTRHLNSAPPCVNLDAPEFRVWQLDACGRATSKTLEDYLTATPESIPIIYVHGYRMEARNVTRRGLRIYRSTMRSRSGDQPSVKWLIFSWPSAQEGFILSDLRIKARRTEAQGLYLAWLLREMVQRGQRPRVVGFSFGARVTTGALHALAGGALSQRTLPGPRLQGAEISAALLAPAIGSTWLCENGYHGLAAKNLTHLTLLYSKRDAVLRRYPFLYPGSQALGYRGPSGFASRYDGRRLDTRIRNCSNTVGRHHVEAEYYSGTCNAGRWIFQGLMEGPDALEPLVITPETRDLMVDLEPAS